MACKYLDFQDRKKIAKMYQEEARVLDIAYKIGCRHFEPIPPPRNDL